MAFRTAVPREGYDAGLQHISSPSSLSQQSPTAFKHGPPSEGRAARTDWPSDLAALGLAIMGSDRLTTRRKAAAEIAFSYVAFRNPGDSLGRSSTTLFTAGTQRLWNRFPWFWLSKQLGHRNSQSGGNLFERDDRRIARCTL